MIDEQIHTIPTEGEQPEQEPASGQETVAADKPTPETPPAAESAPMPQAASVPAENTSTPQEASASTEGASMPQEPFAPAGNASIPQDPAVPADSLREDDFSEGPAEPIQEAVEPPIPSVEPLAAGEETPPEEPAAVPPESAAAPVQGSAEETIPAPQPGAVYPPQGAQPYPPQPGAYGYPPLYQQPLQTPYGYPQPPATFPGASPYGAAQQPYAAPAFQPQQPAGPVYYGYGQQPGYPYYGAEPPRPPKKKMPVGLKVFIWIASILAAAALIGLFGYLAYHAATTERNLPYGNTPGFQLPVPQQPDGGDEDDIPDFDDGVIPPDSKEEDPSEPDVDITPNTEGITIHKKPNGQELTSQEVYKKVVKSTVTVAVTLTRNGQEQNSTGTGIIATSDGYIITNSHVVLNSKSSVVKIITSSGEEYEAVVVGVDRTTDLAILKTNDHNFTPAEFGDAAELEIGDSVVAIGNPGGEKFSGSMTGGYVSGLDREVGRYSENGMTYIQTDAAINPGNSGGPLVNMYGQVIGINSSKIITEGYEGMGFAIPVSKAQPIINELLSGGYVKGRVRLGITGMDVTDAMVAIYQVPQGFMITEIGEESAFTGTEAEEGDIITAIDGETVTGLSDISNLLLKYAPGDTAEITLYRQNGTELKVTVTLLEDKGETQK